MVLLRDHPNIEVHLLQEYIETHFPHSKSAFKKYYNSFLLMLLYMISNIFTTLYVKITTFYRLDFSGGHVRNPFVQLCLFYLRHVAK